MLPPLRLRAILDSFLGLLGGITLKLIAKFAQGASLLMLLLPFAAVSRAAETARASAPVEEIVVTGSYIRGSAENAALPVDVVTSQELAEVGNPNMVEFIKSLGIASGLLGETNQFQAPAQGYYGVTTINLRGLGSSRTLVLINGHRQVSTEAVGVDVAAFPINAFGRTEILKDGAAALYGSDAIAGVVNFITRRGFEGFEVTGSNNWIEGSDGNQELGMLFGWAGEKSDAFVALEYNHRSELAIKNKDWGLKPFAQNFNGGWSTTGMPGTTYFYNPNSPLAAGTLQGTNQQVYSGYDPACTQLGGNIFPSGGLSCSFQFTYFDNLIEDTKQYKSYAEYNLQLNDTTTWHVEGMYGRSDIPHWASSPAYPPNSLFGPDRIIPANNPGLIQYKADYPQLFTCVATNTCAGQTGANPTVPAFPAGTTAANVEVYQKSRMLGVQGRGTGNPLHAAFKTNTYRLATDLSGEFGSVGYDFAVSYSSREYTTHGYDMQVQGMAFALNGLGGPGCTPGGSDPATSTAGSGPCQWFNPFSEAIPFSMPGGGANPTYKSAVANSQELIDWLTLEGEGNYRNELLVWDAVFNGDTGIKLPGGTIGWAGGIQARNEKYKVHLNDVANVAADPCPWTNPAAAQAPFNFTTPDQISPNCTVKFGLVAFGVPSDQRNDTRNIYAAFAEFALPVTDTIDMQAAVRFEDYGTTGGGSTVDPKLAIRWQASDWLALRGSISTTFRGPPQSYLSGVDTVLLNISAINAYRAVNYVGNPDLQPERATASNLGLIIETHGVTATLDYWNFDFSDPIQLESAQQIINAYTANGCQGDGTVTNPYGPGVGTPVCDDDLRPRFVPFGTSPSQLASVDTYYINGSNINTNGIDFSLKYDFDALGGAMTIGTEGTYTMEYTSQDFRDKDGLILAKGGDFAGQMNLGLNPFYPLPDLKGNAYIRYNRNNLNLSWTYRYVADYEDKAAHPLNAYLQDVENFTTQDVTAIYRWNEFTFAASVFNLTDEDPPEVYLPQNYDPYTVNPYGRMYKLQVTYTMGGG